MECLMDCLGGEDDEGEDVANKTKTGNNGEKNSFYEEGEGV